MDTNGIILGLEGDVTCYSSGLDIGYARDFVTREESYLRTESVDNAWLGLDFGNKFSVKPTHYTVRYANGSEFQTLPRNWLFQGANDVALLKTKAATEIDPKVDPNWVTLVSHDNDPSFGDDPAFMVRTFPVPKEKQKQAYRIFRLVSTGTCADGVSKNLCFTSFEIYGTRLERNVDEEIAQDADDDKFKQKTDYPYPGTGTKYSFSKSNRYKRYYATSERVANGYLWT